MSVGETGNGEPMDTRLSPIVVNYIIALKGEYPQRS